jgi:hypothetical protein
MLNRKQKKSILNKPNSKLSKQLNIKGFVNELLGLLPYEKKIYENLVLGKDKKALRIASKRLGNIKRSRKKRDSLNFFLRKKKSN